MLKTLGSATPRYHAVADEGVAFREMAEVIGRRLHIPVVSKSKEEAADHFGRFALFAGLDCEASSKQTQEELGWHPTQPALIPAELFRSKTENVLSRNEEELNDQTD